MIFQEVRAESPGDGFFDFPLRPFVIGRGHIATCLAQRWRLPNDQRWMGELAELPVDQLRHVRPDFIVNCAGKADPTWCEANPAEAYRCNMQAPRTAHRIAAKALGNSALFIHLGTGCLWDGPYGPGGEAWRSNAATTATSVYALSKEGGDLLLCAERAMPTLILRPRFVFSWLNHPRNMLVKMRSYAKLTDVDNSMTSVDTIAKTVLTAAAVFRQGTTESVKALLSLMAMCVYDRPTTAVMTPLAVGRLLHKAGLREAPEKIEKEELDKTLKPRRVDVVMQDELFEKLVDPPTMEKAWLDAIKEFKAGLTTNECAPGKV